MANNIYFSRDTRVFLVQNSATIKTVTTIATGNTFTTSTSHGYAAGDSITAQETVSGVVKDKTYTVKTIPSATTFTLAETLGSATLAAFTNGSPSGLTFVSTNVWEIPVLNGFSFTQTSNTSEVTLNEMSDSAGVSRRGRTMFTDSQAPADWSFDTYVRPTIASTLHRSVEEPLWANFVANNAYTGGVWGTNTVNPVSTTSQDIKFTNSNKTELGKFDLVFVTGGASTATAFDTGTGAVAGTAYGVKMFRVYDASINEVSISFDIDGIAMLSWSGNGARLRDFGPIFSVDAAIRTGMTQSTNFIRNRLTQATVIRKDFAGATLTTYNITLTGGTITINNNLTYLTPEVIGTVNTPLGHITGTRSVSGSFTCYLDSTADGSGDLWSDLTEDTTATRNYFDLTFYIGGASGTADVARAPGVAISIPKAHVTIPSTDISDVISLSVEFNALPTDLGTADEIDLIRYIGVA